MPSTLRSHRLRRIIGAYTVNRLGTWFGFVALSLAVFDHTHSALAVAGLLIAGQALPAFAAPALAARVEASSRHGVLSGLYIFEGVVTTVLAVLLWHFWLPAILILAALDGTAALAASALLRAETARAAREQAEVEWDGAREKEFETFAQAAERQANATLNIAFSATFMLGPAIAGVVVAAAGAPAALFIDAASFLICGAMLLDLSPHAEDAADATVLERLRAAWEYVNEVPLLRALLLAEAIALVFFNSADPIEIAYAKVTLHAGDRGFGLLLGVWGVGVVIGSFVFARSPKRGLGAMLTSGTLAMGLAYIGFAAAGSLALACVAAVVGGLGNGVEWASVISLVQRLTPPALHGRLMSAVESIGALSLALGLGLGGALVALSSPRTAFLTVGIGATAMTFVFLALVLRGLDRFVAASLEATAMEAAPTQLDESVSHGLVSLLQATVPASIPTREHLKSDVISAVKYDRTS
ncbi:MAG TPA: MFS transporter [Solirubrobacteraceae bacterium]